MSSVGWKNKILWVSTVLAIVILLAVSVFLVGGVIIIFTNADVENTNLVYRLHVFHILSSLLKRTVGFFTGFGLIFSSSAIMLYTIKENSELELELKQHIRLSLTSISPGLFGIAFGVVLVVASTAFKDEFPPPTQVASWETNEATVRLSDMPEDEVARILESMSLQELREVAGGE